MRQLLLLTIVATALSCGKPNVKKRAKDVCENWSLHPKNSAALECAIALADPTEPIALLGGATYELDLSLHRSLRLQGVLVDGKRPVVVSTTLVAADRIAATEVDFRVESMVLSGPVEFKNVNVDAQTVRMESSDVIFDGVEIAVDLASSIDARQIWARDLYLMERELTASWTLSTGSGEISQGVFDTTIALSQREPITAPLYVHHNRFSKSVAIRGVQTYFERNCVSSEHHVIATEVQNDNRYTAHCTSVGSEWCTGEVDTVSLGIGFDRSRILIGDFDGDRKDDLLRIGSSAWHLYDPDEQRWQLWRRETSVPWTLAVGDFDGDGADDVFEANGVVFRYAPRGKEAWNILRDCEDGLARQHLQLADVTGDGVTDVVRPGPGELLFVSKSGREAFEEVSAPPGPGVYRWLADIGSGAAAWITFRGGKYESFSFEDRVSKPIDFLLDPPDPRTAIGFGRFEAGIMCESDAGSSACHGSHGGSGAGGSSTGWRQIAQGDFTGDGVQQLVRTHCGTHDPCELGDSHDRIVTYNVNHAGIRTADELAQQIAWFDAKVVVLQEVDRHTKRNPYDMAERLAKSAGFAHWAFFKSNDYRGGDYGHLVLSRDPILDQKTIKLPDHDDPKEWSEHYIAASFSTGGRTFLATHIINKVWRNGVDLSKTQQKQVEALIGEIKSRTPDVVLGDFNLAPDSALYAALIRESGYHDVWAGVADGDGITFSDLGGSPRRIDYILTRKKSDAECARVPALITSDHYPLIAGFKPTP